MSSTNIIWISETKPNPEFETHEFFRVEMDRPSTLVSRRVD
jgi:hypothetical protein